MPCKRAHADIALAGLRQLADDRCKRLRVDVWDPGEDAADGGFDPLRGNVRRGRLRECGCGASDDFAESGEVGVLVVRLGEGRS